MRVSILPTATLFLQGCRLVWAQSDAQSATPESSKIEREVSPEEQQATVLISAVGSVVALLCIMLVVIVWRNKATTLVGTDPSSSNAQPMRLLENQQNIRTLPPMTYPRSNDEEPHVSDVILDFRHGETFKELGFSESHLSACQMCLERPRSVLILPCRCGWPKPLCMSCYFCATLELIIIRGAGGFRRGCGVTHPRLR